MKRVVLTLAFLVCATSAQASFWCDQFGIGCPKPSWEPGYNSVWVADGFGNETVANRFYFADSVTADTLREMFRAAYVSSRPCVIVAPPGNCTSQQRFLAFQDRSGKIVLVIAGLLAANYTNNPDGKFPNVAFNLSRMALEARDIDTTALLPTKQARKSANQVLRKAAR